MDTPLLPMAMGVRQPVAMSILQLWVYYGYEHTTAVATVIHAGVYLHNDSGRMQVERLVPCSKNT